MTTPMIQVHYKKTETRQLGMDIFAPASSEHHTRTAIILLHGGAWRVGSPSMMHGYVSGLISQGFVVFAPEYRLLGEAAWPAQIEDVKSAVKWVRSRACQWNIDPDKIAVQGFSAGGHLALLAGATPEDPAYDTGYISDQENDEARKVSDAVNAVVAFFPPVDFTIDKSREPGQHAAHRLIGKKNATSEMAKSISPVQLVTPDFPPTFLLHGTSDSMVSHEASIRMANALETNGVDMELHLYPRQDHEFAQLPSLKPLILLEVGHFLQRILVDPEAYHRENITLNPFAARRQKKQMQQR